jgi:EmrB/QacA subfamily drug resistance transporter
VDSSKEPPRRDPRLLAAIVASALFMQNLDSSAVATALPAMARDLGQSPASLGVAITAYLVSLTVFVPVSGWVADRFGPKRVFLVAILVFSLGSSLCAVAGGVGTLIAARVLQGLGGAMMVPVARLLLLRQVRKDEMLNAMAWLTMPALLGPISGPPLGGLLTDAFGWRAVFLMNLPIGVIGFILVAWLVPRLPATDPGPPDLRGLLLLGAALALSMIGLETLGRHVLPDLLSFAALATGLLLGIAAIRHCRRVTRPALDLGLLTIPTFRTSVMFGSLFRIGAGATPFLVPLLLQVGFGKSASEAGLVSFATALGALTMKPIVRPVLQRYGFRRVLMAGAFASAVGVALGAAFSPTWPLMAIFVVLALGGLCRSLQFTALNTLGFVDMPSGRLAAATSFSTTAQQLSQALGVVLASTALEASQALAGRAALATADFSVGFLVAAAVALASLPFFAQLRADAGAAVSGHQGEINRR